MSHQQEHVLVVSAHPDDEVLGVGGTIARHVDQGDDVVLLIVAEGSTSRTDADAAQAGDEVAALRACAQKACAALGAREVRFLGFADQRLDGLDLLDITKAIETVVAELKPTVVYTHHGGDLNEDHRIVHRAVLTATRPLPGSSVHTVRVFETVSSTEWAPSSADAFVADTYVDIERQFERKMDALRHYDQEMRPAPHARSYEAVEALSVMRGASAGMAKAEAFATVLHLLRRR